jgi:tetratricopeptide (TPR) repeat protein
VSDKTPPSEPRSVYAARLRERFANLQQRVDEAPASDDRQRLKQELAALYRLVDGVTAELGVLQGDIRTFMEQWKAREAPLEAVPSIADHLGASTHTERGWSRLAQGDFTAAEESLRTALDLAPTDARAEGLLGWALMLQGRLVDALAVANRSLARDPDQPLALITVGYVHLQRRQFDEAESRFTRALTGGDRIGTLYGTFYLGVLRRTQGAYDDATARLEQTVQLAPAMGEAYYELGWANWEAGRTAEARKAWELGTMQSGLSRWGILCKELLHRLDSEKESFRFD